MHPNTERVQSFLERHGSAARVVELDGSTRTAAEAAEAIGTTVAQIAKSLVFVARRGPEGAVEAASPPEGAPARERGSLQGDSLEEGERPILAVTSGVNRVSVEKLSRLAGADVTRADADAVRRHTGFPIGGVPPVAHERPLDVLIDRDLLQYAEVWAAAGTPRSVFRTSPDELKAMTGGTIADLKEDH
jgi:prolyl-tRNA editing enzyme YbaK/EbsC (Cys-tRNA(Pro) deacylase)